MLGLELALIGLILVSAALVALIRDPIGAIAVYAAFSFGLALLWMTLAAPDVALTEAAVGAGVLVILLLVAAVRTEPNDVAAFPAVGPTVRPINGPALLVVGGLTLALAASVRHFPAVGDPGAPAVSETDPTGATAPYAVYLGEVTADLGITNAVAAVLVVYRSLDTLGELVVVVTALVGVLIVLERSGVHEGIQIAGPDEDTVDYPDPLAMSPVGSTAVRLVVPLVFVFGVYLVTAGATLPGGGFQGGVVVGATFVLLALIFGSAPAAQWSEATVLVWAIVLGLGAFVLYLVVSSVERVAVAPLLAVEVIEIGIGMVVGGAVTSLVYAMAVSDPRDTQSSGSELEDAE